MLGDIQLLNLVGKQSWQSLVHRLKARKNAQMPPLRWRQARAMVECAEWGWITWKQKTLIFNIFCVNNWRTFFKIWRFDIPCCSILCWLGSTLDLPSLTMSQDSFAECLTLLSSSSGSGRQTQRFFKVEYSHFPVSSKHSYQFGGMASLQVIRCSRSLA